MNTQRIRFICGRDFVAVLISWLLFLALGNTVAMAQVVWQQTNGPEGGEIFALAVNANGDIFAGTNGGGVFRSTNNGDSWVASNNGLTSTTVNALAINASGGIFAATFDRVFRSTNNGNSWTVVSSGLPTTFVRAITINASGEIFVGFDGSGVFRSTNNGNSWTAVNSGMTNTFVQTLAINANGNIFAGTSGSGVFRSTNNGNSWTAVNSGMTNTFVQTLAINANGNIFAGTSGSGVFRSTNNGDSWSAVNNGLTYTDAGGLIITANGDILAAMTSGVYRSIDDGNSWVDANNGLTNTHVNAFTLSPRGDIFAATVGDGVFRSANNGDYWTAVNSGLTSTVVFALAINARKVIFAGTNGGVFRSTDSDNSWTAVNNGLRKYVFALTTNALGDIFAGTFDGVFRSTDNGNSWTAVNSGLTNTFVFALAINASGDIFAGAGGGVFRSTNNGEDWTIVNSGLANTDVAALAINASGDIFAGTRGGGVFRSTNNGNSWAAANNGLTNTDINTLAINASGVIFAGTRGGGVFRSTNNGNSWTTANSGLTTTFVRALAINASGDIFVGTLDGVFLSTNNGNSWIPTNTGLTNTIVRSFAINVSEVIFVGTDGNGVFRGVDYPSTISMERTYNFRTLANPSDYKASDYRIVGLPGVSNKSLKEFLSGDQGKDWQIYWDNGSFITNPSDFLDVFDGSDTFRFKVGRAFWLISRDTLTIKTTADAAPLINQEAQIELHSGWNLITSPFNRSVAWTAVQTANSISSEQIHAFTGTYGSPSAILEPYVGYYFYNDDPARSILRVPLSAVSPISTSAQTYKRPVWKVEIGLTSKDFLDQSTSFGIANEASQELDQFDYRKPRTVATIPNAYFSKPKWDKHYSLFATDIRPEFKDKESWDFEVQSAQREELKLTFSGIERVPLQFEVYLIDQARGRYVSLREDSLYTFTPAADISKFTVLVGKSESIKEQLESIPPKELSLGQNYPNPFNPLTAIPVSIPVITEIKLKIYDILGKEVKTLYAGSLTPGRHFFHWNGRDERGNTLATGVYFYRLSTSTGMVLTHKMILLK